jgi:hypothetical protein
MLHCLTFDGAASQLQGGHVVGGLSGKLVEQETIIQPYPNKAEAVEGREGVRDEMSAP